VGGEKGCKRGYLALQICAGVGGTRPDPCGPAAQTPPTPANRLHDALNCRGGGQVRVPRSMLCFLVDDSQETTPLQGAVREVVKNLQCRAHTIFKQTALLLCWESPWQPLTMNSQLDRYTATHFRAVCCQGMGLSRQVKSPQFSSAHSSYSMLIEREMSTSNPTDRSEGGYSPSRGEHRGVLLNAIYCPALQQSATFFTIFDCNSEPRPCSR